MKIYLALLVLFMAVSIVWAGGTFTVTETEYIVISGNTSDTLGREMITPDSIRIVVSDSAGTELHDAWYESVDAQCVLNGDVITFFDQWEDINGAASIGIFSIVATIASDGSGNVDVFSNQNYIVHGVSKTVEASLFNYTVDSVIVDVSAAAANNGLCNVISDTTWDEILTGATHNISTSASRRLRILEMGYVIEDGTAQRGGDSSIVLASAVSESDDWFNSCVIVIIKGTGEGQARVIRDFTGATDSISIHPGDAWVINPNNTSQYVIVADVKGHVQDIHNTALTQMSERLLTPFSLFEGTKSYTVYTSDSDIIYIVDTSGDTTSKQIFYHYDGIDGQRPDTTETIDY
jgi:hypothetical protein